jgi:hypothetical protein
MLALILPWGHAAWARPMVKTGPHNPCHGVRLSARWWSPRPVGVCWWLPCGEVDVASIVEGGATHWATKGLRGLTEPFQCRWGSGGAVARWGLPVAVASGGLRRPAEGHVARGGGRGWDVVSNSTQRHTEWWLTTRGQRWQCLDEIQLRPPRHGQLVKGEVGVLARGLDEGKERREESGRWQRPRHFKFTWRRRN